MNNITQQKYTDILETLSHLSSDEVFTPPDVANEILDLLPEDVWTDPNIKILDPCTKSGVFLREAAKRLMIGLKDQFKNEDLLRKHIFKNMLYGVAITEITSLISKRSLYYSKDASSQFSIIQFDSKEGNIRHRRVEHDFFANKCRLCGASEGELNRDESRENYAYEFIHNDSILSGSLRYSDSFLNYDEVTSGRTDVNNSTDDDELSYNLSLTLKKDKFNLTNLSGENC